MRRLAGQGCSDGEIAEFVGRSRHGVVAVLRPGPLRVIRREWAPGPARWSLAEREGIDRGLVRALTYTAIAATLGRAVSTVSREVRAHGGRAGYEAWRAHQDAGAAARRPKTAKLAARPALAEVVSAGWQSCGRLTRSPRGCASTSLTIR